MGSCPEYIYYTQEVRDRDRGIGAVYKSNKKKLEVRNFDARRVSRGILNEILAEIHKVNHPRPSPYPAPCRIIKIMKEIPQQAGKPEPIETKKEAIPLNSLSSMCSLIVWNISKALDMKPCLDLKSSITAAKRRLDSDAHALTTVSQQPPEEQHLLCALLAWQQLGHHNADSLYKFVKPKIRERGETSAVKSDFKQDRISTQEANKSKNDANHVDQKKVKPSDTGSFGSHTSGPIVALPMVPNVVMRFVKNEPTGPVPPPKLVQEVRRTENECYKQDPPCCINTQCAAALATLDQNTEELRTRAQQLIKRESSRVRMLQRAEEAWKELEAGYLKRIASEEERANDFATKMKKLKVERDAFKDSSKILTDEVATKMGDFETVRLNLTEVEKEVCALATTKLQLTEENARGEGNLAEELARALQYDRDLMFQEEQARRKLESIQNDADSARTLACESERAMRAELAALRDQIEAVCEELMAENEDIMKTKEELAKLREEKKEMIEDLEGCKEVCDKKMQEHLDDLKKKREKLLTLQEQVLECRCKLPTDVTVQVKRTPSLAAMCRCAPEDHLLESCSCTSLRGRLLTNLLVDLFEGLQSELSNTGVLMPCQLLKCLEDQHSWERPSATKTNIRNYFSELLKNELDIAIVTAIEKYHARWVGRTCADVAKMEPTLEDDLEEGWQQRAIERRAQELANKLVQDMYHERSEQMERRAKDIISAVQPCDCKSMTTSSAPERKMSKQNAQDPTALFSCMVTPNSMFNSATTSKAIYHNRLETPPSFWKKAIQDVTQLKLQIEDLKKESIKKEDLKVMEQNIFKIVGKTSVNEDHSPITRDTSNVNGENVKKETNQTKNLNLNKLGVAKRQEIKALFNKKGLINEKPTKQSKKQIHEYAVNLCLCGPQKNIKNIQNAQLNSTEKSSCKQNSVKDMPKTPTPKQIKPINIDLPSSEREYSSKMSEFCDSNCKCFHKVPSNASIDRLLQTLVSWKYDLVPQDPIYKNVKRSSSKLSKTAIKDSMSSTSTSDNKNAVIEGDINNDSYNMKADKQGRTLSKQPIATESEYMGTVYLDKSHENICKCMANIESNNQDGCEDGQNNTPFQCINTNTCNCQVYQDMQKDHKRLQTEELKLKTQSNQCQGVRSKDLQKFYKSQHNPKTIKYTTSQKEIKEKSDTNNVSNKTELYSSSSEYNIKFLGVTLDDLISDPVKNRKLKPVAHNTNSLLLPKDKNAEQPNKSPNKLSQSELLGKPNCSTMGKNYQTGLKDTKKCECKAKFEEFASVVNSFLDKHANSRKDDVSDPSLKHVDNRIGSRACCSDVKIGESKDLEVNAFHLLEDHIKEKMKEFKTYSCIPPEEEEKLFSSILQRVKQVISDCTNKMKCCYPGELQNNASWNRAYGLLQEYLKIKIKRVHCLCVFDDKKDAILPDVLAKVSDLIENDFKRLKEISIWKNTKILGIGDTELPPTELPEKDTNTSQAKYNDCEIKNCNVISNFSKQNSNKSMIVKENISSQVPPYLGMEAKSCDVMEPCSNKNARTTETDYIITDSKSNDVMYNTCDCCYNTDKVDIIQFPDRFGNKEVLVNLYAEQGINTTDGCKVSITDTDQAPSRCFLSSGVESMKQTHNTEIGDSDKNYLDEQKCVVNIQNPCAPYVGYTVDCSCDGALGSCFCIKSVVQSNNDKIDSLWKELLVSNKKEYSYIMHGTLNKNNYVDVNCHPIPEDIHVDNTSKSEIISDELMICEATEFSADNEDELVLKYSPENVNLTHHAANTVDISPSLETSYSNNDFYALDLTKNPLPVASGRSRAIKLTNSIFFPGMPIDTDQNSLISGTVTDLDTQTSESCVCDKVPICHVKMLVEHIEKNLVESKCTCDSLISKVCPVHSKRLF